MSEIEGVIYHVEQECRSKGKQLTPQRKLVLKALLHADKALSAYELVDYCKVHFSQDIQAMSVYRILDFLEGEHLAHKLKVSNNYIVCSHILCEHEHGVPQFLICSKCNKISEQTIAPALIKDLKANARQLGFNVDHPQLEIHCICDECAQSSC